MPVLQRDAHLISHAHRLPVQREVLLGLENKLQRVLFHLQGRLHCLVQHVAAGAEESIVQRRRGQLREQFGRTKSGRSSSQLAVRDVHVEQCARYMFDDAHDQLFAVDSMLLGSQLAPEQQRHQDQLVRQSSETLPDARRLSKVQRAQAEIFQLDKRRLQAEKFHLSVHAGRSALREQAENTRVDEATGDGQQ